MAIRQQWLIEPDKPLVQRLGKQFFRQAPSQPGVYLMHDAAGQVVYVGKAKNLRQRLRSYRVANPDRMPRRHLRLVREVVRIDFELCRTEAAALVREAKLLRRLKPKFNRAGVWPGRAQFLTWRFTDDEAQFAMQEVPSVGWDRSGLLGAYAPRLLGSVVRLLWIALHPQAGFCRLPCGWAHNRFMAAVSLACNRRAPEVKRVLGALFWGQPDEFTSWLRTRTAESPSTFDQAAVLADLEEIDSFAASQRKGGEKDACQLPLL